MFIKQDAIAKNFLKIFDRSVSEYDILQWQAIQIQNRCDLLNISHKP